MTTVNRTAHGKSSHRSVIDFNLVGEILQSPGKFFDEIRDGVDLPAKIATLSFATIIFLLIYGAILGSGHPLQAISSALKLPLLFLGSLAACIPALYVFDVLVGSKRSLGQTVTILLTSITIIALLLFSFVPITIVFKLTVNGFQFFKLLNVLFLLVAMLVGLIYLERGLRQTFGSKSNALVSELLYACWIVIFAFVLAQLAWGLRPFFHYPGTEFTLLVGGGNLFAELGSALGEFLGFWVVR